MYKLKPSILFLFFLTSTNFCYAIDNQVIQNPVIKNTVQSINSTKNYSNDDIIKLNSLLDKQDYINFYDVFHKLNVSSEQQIKYLISKEYDGHTPLYWLMADYYAKQNNEIETHKWLYVSIIMTQQDASLCTDPTAKYASQKLLRSFPTAQDLIHKSPQYIAPAMSDVIFFIQNLKTRTNPSWACNFGEQKLNPTTNVLLPKTSWQINRKIVLDKYSAPFNK